MTNKTIEPQIIEEKIEEVSAPDWQIIGKIKLIAKKYSGVKTKYSDLHVRIIDGHKFYKVEDEHVTLLDKPRHTPGFGNYEYNAFTSKYNLFI